MESRYTGGAHEVRLAGAVTIGENPVVREHALIRRRSNHPARIGAAVMIGPHTHVNGSIEADESFIATSASVFSGSRIGQGPRSQVRINGRCPG